MTKSELANQIFEKGSYLCVGLDTDKEKIPKHLLQDKESVLTFNKAIIDATKDFCVAYKINTAFYECMGIEGWKWMQETVRYIPNSHFIIADAKRGDIGNTSLQYAKTFFDTYDFDALTVAPYMGSDSIKPFLDHDGKWAVVLGLTSNKGSKDFQFKETREGRFFYEEVIEGVAQWGNTGNMMFVIGATQDKQMTDIRKIIPHHFLLVPGVGAQGGNLQRISELGLNEEGGLLVNSSRSIIYAGAEKDFAEKAAEKAAGYAKEMKEYLKQYSL